MSQDESHFFGARVWFASSPVCDADGLVDIAKKARQFAGSQRVLLVAEDVGIPPEGDYDSVGALAAALIRLRIDQWLGVGLAVRALSRQVGLEGSWDGESLWCERALDAYDYLRDWPNEGDLIVLTGQDGAEIASLRDLIKGETR